jgi:hypothetical protein
MKFKLIANTTFEADSIDEALCVLGEYFIQLSKDPDSASKIFDSGEISLEKEEKYAK